MSSSLRLIALVFALSGLFATANAATAPAWLSAVAQKKASLEYGKASVAVLLDDGVLDVDRAGTFVTRARYVIKILNAEGKGNAHARVGYNTDSKKIKSFQAWLIRPSGEVITYGKKNTIDVASFSNARELYGESRWQDISAVDDAETGAVFAYECIVEEKSIHSQLIWFFQSSSPVETSTYTVNLPEGWTVEARTFNHAPIDPVVQGKSRTWSLSQLPALEKEPLGPPSLSLGPWLAVDIRPPANAKGINLRSFASWSDISAFFSPRYEEAAKPDEAIKTKANALTKDAKTTWDRIRVLCRHAQKITYIFIALNSGQGGGWLPRPANRVFQCSYGDCKEKTTLLRALLQAQGIESYAVFVYSGDSTHVRPEWTSPGQFNHCITAIKVDDTVENMPGIINHPKLGRLLIFDPTNEFVPPGLIPEEDQGGHALILSGSQSELIALPTSEPKDNRFERKIKVSLGAGGHVYGTIDEKFAGLSSVVVREELLSQSTNDYKATIERWVGRSLPSARTPRVDAKDNFEGAEFNLSVEFHASTYGKPMRDVLLVFKPVMIARRDNVPLKKGKRTQPVIIEPVHFTEETEITLPEGFKIDEPFPPVSLKAPFGTYSAGTTLRDDGRLIFQRALELRTATLPPENYEVARSFFEKILQAEQTPIVLKKN